MKSRFAFIGLLTLLAPVLALAHPGHGHEDPWQPVHFLSNAVHLVPLGLAVAAVAAWSIVKYYRRRNSR